MSSPVTDDYAGLITPWKPISKLLLKPMTSRHNEIKILEGIKCNDLEENISETENIGAVISSYNIAKRDNKELLKEASTDTDIMINGGLQNASDTEISGTAEITDPYVDDNIDDGAQTMGTKIIDTDEDTSQRIDTKCMAVSTCVANSDDHRKVVSHIFGRNKACTRELPDSLWIYWCRKHYQRFKYRHEDLGTWHTRQMSLVGQQLQIFENCGQIPSWTIALRKAEHNKLAEEDKDNDEPRTCWERFLVPYLGVNKTFTKVREVLDVIQRKFNEEEFNKRDKKSKLFPGVEFLPNIHKNKKPKKPAAKKGEITYKKITLDQPAFNRKTRLNAQYIKEKAAKKAEKSTTLKSSRIPSVNDKSADIENHPHEIATVKREPPMTDNGTINPADTMHKSFNYITTMTPSFNVVKRKSMTPIHKTPLNDQPNSQPTKRRRLTRGYEKHGSDDEDTTFIENQNGKRVREAEE